MTMLLHLMNEFYLLNQEQMKELLILFQENEERIDIPFLNVILPMSIYM